MRINKFIAQSGLCSRRAADRLVEEGKVQINGRTAVPGDTAEAADTVLVEGKRIHPVKEHTYLAFYKPPGVICSFSEREKNNLRKYIPEGMQLSYAGRLDVPSEGLMLLTDDGDLIHQLMTGRYGHEKEYAIRTLEAVTEEQLDRMRKGMHLEELKKDTRPCRAKKTEDRGFVITLTQGMNRQIRRMCAACGLTVRKLQRIRIENITLGSLRPGEIRTLLPEETKELKRRAARGKENRR